MQPAVSRRLTLACLLIASAAPIARAEVRAWFELADIEPHNSSIITSQGRPGRPLILAAGDADQPSQFTISFVADLKTSINTWSLDLACADDAAWAAFPSYVQHFDADSPIPLIPKSGDLLTGAAQQQKSSKPLAGRGIELLRFQITVDWPDTLADEIRIYAAIGPTGWSGDERPTKLILADADSLSGDQPGSLTTTPVIIIRKADGADQAINDCNANDIPDDSEIASDPSLDCNNNLIPDDCDLFDQTSPDCNENNLPDECELDCNANSTPDDCDIALGASLDANSDAIPDECADPPAPQQSETTHEINRADLRRFLAGLFGIPEDGLPLPSWIPFAFVGYYALPLIIALTPLDLLNLPGRYLFFELIYALLDAILP